MRSDLWNMVWSNHLLKGCVFFVFSVACPAWLAMEWCWLQTGWQGLQGGQSHTVSEATLDFLAEDSCTDWQWQYLCSWPPPSSVSPRQTLPLLLLLTCPTTSFYFNHSVIIHSWVFTPFFPWNSFFPCGWVCVIFNWPPAGSSMSWMSRLNPRGPGNRSGHSTAAPGPCTADPETCLMVFENHWRQVSRVVNPLFGVLFMFWNTYELLFSMFLERYGFFISVCSEWKEITFNSLCWFCNLQNFN